MSGYCPADPDRSGDLLDLVTHALCDGDPSAAYRWALRYLGGVVNRPTPTKSPRYDREKAKEADEARRQRAGQWYRQAQPIAGSPAEDYLAGRGLTRDIVDYPELLRFAPDCPYVYDEPTKRWTRRPAMLAPVIDPVDGKFLGAHCTYIEQSGGAWRKAPLKPNRKCWGRFDGGVIPLLRGASGKRLRDAPDGDGCLVAEGIENALTAAYLRPELRALAALNVGNLAKIALPPQIGLVVLVVDDDGERTALDEARERASNRWRREGRAVEHMVPTRGYKDLNDQLQKELAL